MHINPFDPSNIILVVSLLLLISILAGKTSSRFGVPTLIFFLIVGMLAGSEGLGGIEFSNPHIAEFVGVVALNFILFSGGLDTRWSTTRPVFGRGLALSTVGVLVTATLVGLFVHYFFGFTIAEGLLLGSIVSSTDAAAVFSILQTKGIRLKNNLGSLLELESGSNDPMAYFLTISLTAIVATGHSDYVHLVWQFVKGFAIGAAMGYAMGRLSQLVINRIRLDADGLYPVLVLGLAMFTYAATNAIGGNGFLSVYLAGIVLGNSDFIHKRSLLKFYDGQAWLMQIILFLTLGLFVYPSKLVGIVGAGVAISLFLIVIARPVSVFLTLLPFRVNIRSKLFISWVGLRGAVPIVFAMYPLIAKLEKAETIFNLVFFIATTSVLVQGTTLPWVARYLKVISPRKQRDELMLGSDSEMKEVVLPETSKAVGKRVVALHFPETAHIMTIKRGDRYITPNGFTKLHAFDRLFILAATIHSFNRVMQYLDVNETEIIKDYTG